MMNPTTVDRLEKGMTTPDGTNREGNQALIKKQGGTLRKKKSLIFKGKQVQ